MAFTGNLHYYKVKKYCKLPIIFENSEKFDCDSLKLVGNDSSSDDWMHEVVDMRPETPN